MDRQPLLNIHELNRFIQNKIERLFKVHILSTIS